ncbi:MAG: putative lipid II flippase FtsW [Elusimicrobia bacterium]|nr:putative lipid II flippase FtsW [Elusimicrobiota bacterium]
MPSRRYVSSPDVSLLLVTLSLVLLGLVMVYSASAILAEQRFGSPHFFLVRQGLWVGVGMVTLLCGMAVDYHQLQRWARPLLVISILCLVMVLLLGHSVAGARRWIRLGGIGFQPTELARFACLVTFADFLDRKRSALASFRRGVLPLLVAMGLVVGLIAAQPDLGTPILIVTVGLVMLFIAGARWQYLAWMITLSVGLAALGVAGVGYRRHRLAAFFNPWADPQGRGYQIVQSLVALGSGGWWGKGLGQSEQKLLYLPAPHTDFIFPIIGEELGFMGALGVLALFVFLSFRGARIASRAPDLFGQLLAAGVTLAIAFQAILNIAIASGMVPTKGLSLPLVSFGGSSLVCTLGSIGVLLNISRQAAHLPLERWR